MAKVTSKVQSQGELTLVSKSVRGLAFFVQSPTVLVAARALISCFGGEA